MDWADHTDLSAQIRPIRASAVYLTRSRTEFGTLTPILRYSRPRRSRKPVPLSERIPQD